MQTGQATRKPVQLWQEVYSSENIFSTDDHRDNFKEVCIFSLVNKMFWMYDSLWLSSGQTHTL